VDVLSVYRFQVIRKMSEKRQNIARGDKELMEQARNEATMLQKISLDRRGLQAERVGKSSPFISVSGSDLLNRSSHGANWHVFYTLSTLKGPERK
jgi:hypothetical protein